MIIDFKGSGVRKQNLPLHIHGEIVKTVESLKYLGVTLTVQLTWSTNISQLVKKAQQRLFILRKLKQAKPLQKVCRSAVKSILTNSNSVVCQLCCCREERAAPSGESIKEHCWDGARTSGLHLCHQFDEGRQYQQGQYTPISLEQFWTIKTETGTVFTLKWQLPPHYTLYCKHGTEIHTSIQTHIICA